MRNQPAIRQLVVYHYRVTIITRLAAAAKARPERVVRRRTEKRHAGFIENLKIQVGYYDDMNGANRSVGIGRITAAQVGRAIKTDDWTRYSNLAEHSLHNLVRQHRTDRSARNGPLFLELRFRALRPRNRFHVAQWLRDVELHYLHKAAISGAEDRLRTAGLHRARLREHNNCDCRKAEQNAK